jgi:predicted DNA-binding protein
MTKPSSDVIHKTPRRVGHDPVRSLRLPDDLIERVDAWAKANDCTRSEAIRRLVEKGLT